MAMMSEVVFFPVTVAAADSSVASPVNGVGSSMGNMIPAGVLMIVFANRCCESSVAMMAEWNDRRGIGGGDSSHTVEEQRRGKRKRRKGRRTQKRTRRRGTGTDRDGRGNGTADKPVSGTMMG